MRQKTCTAGLVLAFKKKNSIANLIFPFFFLFKFLFKHFYRNGKFNNLSRKLTQNFRHGREVFNSLLLFYSTKTSIKFKNRYISTLTVVKKIWKLYGVFFYVSKNDFQNRNFVEDIYNAEIERTRREKKKMPPSRVILFSPLANIVVVAVVVVNRWAYVEETIEIVQLYRSRS